MAVPIRSVLVASDLTESSDEVVRAAAQLAAFAKADLHIINVQEPLHPLYPAGETVADMQRRLPEASQRLTEQLQRTGTSESIKSSRIEFGSPSREILKRGEEVGADLIVIGPHLRRRLEVPLLGTTADRLVRSSAVPCLIVRGPISLPLRRVLMATDFSEAAQVALREAFEWAVALGVQPTEAPEPTELRVVHVLQLVGEFGTSSLKKQLTTILHDQVEAARKQVSGSESLRVGEEVIQHASAADEIVRLAASGTDLLVVATHGHTALGRALIGSTASAVSREAPCPVLLVPPAPESGVAGDAVGSE